MLNSVDFPVCINPTEELRQIAEKKNWDIVNVDNIIGLVKKKLKSTIVC